MSYSECTFHVSCGKKRIRGEEKYSHGLLSGCIWNRNDCRPFDDGSHSGEERLSSCIQNHWCHNGYRSNTRSSSHFLFRKEIGKTIEMDRISPAHSSQGIGLMPFQLLPFPSLLLQLHLQQACRSASRSGQIRFRRILSPVSWT